MKINIQAAWRSRRNELAREILMRGLGSNWESMALIPHAAVRQAFALAEAIFEAEAKDG